VTSSLPLFRALLIGPLALVLMFGPASALELDRPAVAPPKAAKSSCYRKLFCFHTAEAKNGIDAWVQALTDTELTFTMRTTQKNLIGPTRTDPVVLTRPGTIHLAKLRPKDRHSWRYYFKYTYHPGRPDTAQPATDALYQLPFPTGRRYKVSQGQKASSTHKKREAYAVDWNLRTGDPVHAARDGRVVGAGGWSKSKKRGRGNFIWVRHTDGTYAWYLHLMKDGVVVRRGQQIKTGQLIGYAGNTGKSSGPHLHFQVSVPTSGRYAFRTIPFRLQTSKGVVTKIKSGDLHQRPK